MLPKSHIIISFSIVLILTGIFHLPLIYVFILFCSAILIDVDHYLLYLYKQKNLSLKKLLFVLPIHFILCEILIFMSLLRGKFKQAIASQIGVIGWIPSLPSILKKREYIQSRIRKINDKMLFASVERNPSFNYYSHFFFNPEGRFNEKEV